MSLEINSGRPKLSRPKTLSSSQSEGAITVLPNQSKAHRRISDMPGSKVSSILDEQDSSPESTDSASLGGDKGREKKKKKGKIFRKILGKDSDKTKVS